MTAPFILLTLINWIEVRAFKVGSWHRNTISNYGSHFLILLILVHCFLCLAEENNLLMRQTTIKLNKDRFSGQVCRISLSALLLDSDVQCANVRTPFSHLKRQRCPVLNGPALNLYKLLFPRLFNMDFCRETVNHIFRYIYFPYNTL